jgi:TP901 family phage tail tape measure protein
MASRDAVINVGLSVSNAEVSALINKVERAVQTRSIKLPSLDSRGMVEPLGRISRSAIEFEKSMDAANARVIAFGASVGVLAGVARAFKNLAQDVVEFEKKMTDINVILGASEKQLKTFSAGLFAVAKETGQSFRTVADAATELSRQGLGMEETLGRVKGAMILARLASMSVDDAVSTLTSTINAFNREALNWEKVVNRMASVDAAFAVSTQDLAEGIKRTASAAQDANVSFNETISLITSIQQITARGGSVIGNSLKTIFTRLSRSTTINQLRELGVAIDESQTGVQKLRALSAALEGADKLTSNRIKELAGGVFQINAISAALGDLGKEYSIYSRALEIANTTTDEAIKRNEKLNQTVSALINKTKVEINELFAGVGDSGLTDGFKQLIGALEGSLSKINELRREGKSGPKDNLGAYAVNSMVEGLVKTFTGPLVIGGVKIFGKLLGNTIKFTSETLKNLSGASTIMKEQERVQRAMQAALSVANDEMKTRLLLASSTLEQERLILQVQREQNNLRATQLSTTSGLITSKAIRQNFRSGSHFAGGYVPEVQEAKSIKKGVGGARPSARPVSIPNFNFGNGVRGKAVVNTDEYLVPNYAFGGTAVFNRDMIQTMGMPKGARRVSAASGYVPNLAKKKRHRFPKRISIPQMERNINKRFQGADDETIRYYGKAYEDYNNIVNIATKTMGVSPELFAGVMSALSPNSAVERNILDAINTFSYIEKYKPQSASDFLQMKSTTFFANRRKAFGMVTHGEMLTGNKRNAFVENILNPHTGNKVTVDYRAQGDVLNKIFTANNAPALSDRNYQRASQAFRNVGEQRGMSGLEVQAATWTLGRIGTEASIGQLKNKAIIKHLYENPQKMKDYDYVRSLLDIRPKDFFKKTGIPLADERSLITMASGYVPNFASPNLLNRGLASKIGGGHFGVVNELKNKNIVTKRFKKPDHDLNQKEIAFEFLVNRLANEKLSNKAIEFIPPIGNLERSLKRGYIGKRKVNAENVKKLTPLALETAESYIYKSIDSGIPSLGGAKFKYIVEKFGRQDIHAQNFTVNNAGVKFLNKVARTRSPKFSNAYSKRKQNLIINSDKVMEEFAQSGGKIEVFDAFAPYARLGWNIEEIKGHIEAASQGRLDRFGNAAGGYVPNFASPFLQGKGKAPVLGGGAAGVAFGLPKDRTAKMNRGRSLVTKQVFNKDELKAEHIIGRFLTENFDVPGITFPKVHGELYRSAERGYFSKDFVGNIPQNLYNAKAISTQEIREMRHLGYIMDDYLRSKLGIANSFLLRDGINDTSGNQMDTMDLGWDTHAANFGMNDQMFGKMMKLAKKGGISKLFGRIRAIKDELGPETVVNEVENIFRSLNKKSGAEVQIFDPAYMHSYKSINFLETFENERNMEIYKNTAMQRMHEAVDEMAPYRKILTKELFNRGSYPKSVLRAIPNNPFGISPIKPPPMPPPRTLRKGTPTAKNQLKFLFGTTQPQQQNILGQMRIPTNQLANKTFSGIAEGYIPNFAAANIPNINKLGMKIIAGKGIGSGSFKDVYDVESITNGAGMDPTKMVLSILKGRNTRDIEKLVELYSLGAPVPQVHAVGMNNNILDKYGYPIGGYKKKIGLIDKLHPLEKKTPAMRSIGTAQGFSRVLTQFMANRGYISGARNTHFGVQGDIRPANIGVTDPKNNDWAEDFLEDLAKMRGLVLSPADLNFIENEINGMGLKIFDVGFLKPNVKGKGFVIPNFALDPIKQSIGRELAALKERGIGSKRASDSIFIGHDPRVGVAVGNYIDEPSGTISEGIRKHGKAGTLSRVVPNFAAAPDSGGSISLPLLRTEKGAMAPVKELNALVSKYFQDLAQGMAGEASKTKGKINTILTKGVTDYSLKSMDQVFDALKVAEKKAADLISKEQEKKRIIGGIHMPQTIKKAVSPKWTTLESIAADPKIKMPNKTDMWGEGARIGKQEAQKSLARQSVNIAQTMRGEKYLERIRSKDSLLSFSDDDIKAAQKVEASRITKRFMSREDVKGLGVTSTKELPKGLKSTLNREIKQANDNVLEGFVNKLRQGIKEIESNVYDPRERSIQYRSLMSVAPKKSSVLRDVLLDATEENEESIRKTQEQAKIAVKQREAQYKKEIERNTIRNKMQSGQFLSVDESKTMARDSKRAVIKQFMSDPVFKAAGITSSRGLSDDMREILKSKVFEAGAGSDSMAQLAFRDSLIQQSRGLPEQVGYGRFGRNLFTTRGIESKINQHYAGQGLEIEKMSPENQKFYKDFVKQQALGRKQTLSARAGQSAFGLSMAASMLQPIVTNAMPEGAAKSVTSGALEWGSIGASIAIFNPVAGAIAAIVGVLSGGTLGALKAANKEMETFSKKLEKMASEFQGNTDAAGQYQTTQQKLKDIVESGNYTENDIIGLNQAMDQMLTKITDRDFKNALISVGSDMKKMGDEITKYSLKQQKAISLQQGMTEMLQVKDRSILSRYDIGGFRFKEAEFKQDDYRSVANSFAMSIDQKDIGSTLRILEGTETLEEKFQALGMAADEVKTIMEKFGPVIRNRILGETVSSLKDRQRYAENSEVVKSTAIITSAIKKAIDGMLLVFQTNRAIEGIVQDASFQIRQRAGDLYTGMAKTPLEAATRSQESQRIGLQANQARASREFETESGANLVKMMRDNLGKGVEGWINSILQDSSITNLETVIGQFRSSLDAQNQQSLDVLHTEIKSKQALIDAEKAVANRMLDISIKMDEVADRHQRVAQSFGGNVFDFGGFGRAEGLATYTSPTYRDYDKYAETGGGLMDLMKALPFVEQSIKESGFFKDITRKEEDRQLDVFRERAVRHARDRGIDPDMNYIDTIIDRYKTARDQQPALENHLGYIRDDINDITTGQAQLSIKFSPESVINTYAESLNTYAANLDKIVKIQGMQKEIELKTGEKRGVQEYVYDNDISNASDALKKNLGAGDISSLGEALGVDVASKSPYNALMVQTYNPHSPYTAVQSAELGYNHAANPVLLQVQAILNKIKKENIKDPAILRRRLTTEVSQSEIDLGNRSPEQVAEGLMGMLGIKKNQQIEELDRSIQDLKNSILELARGVGGNGNGAGGNGNGTTPATGADTGGNIWSSDRAFSLSPSSPSEQWKPPMVYPTNDLQQGKNSPSTSNATFNNIGRVKDSVTEFSRNLNTALDEAGKWNFPFLKSDSRPAQNQPNNLPFTATSSIRFTKTDGAKLKSMLELTQQGRLLAGDTFSDVRGGTQETFTPDTIRTLMSRRSQQETGKKIKDGDAIGGMWSSFTGGFESAAYRTKEELLDMQAVGMQVASTLQDSFSQAFASFANGTMTAKEAFRSFAQSILQGITNILSQKLTESLIALVIPAGAGGVKPAAKNGFSGIIPNLASGSKISMAIESAAIKAGVGGASRSAYPVMLNGFKGEGYNRIVANSDEFLVRNYNETGKDAIFNKQMVEKIGGLDALNKLGTVTRVASGGSLPADASSPKPAGDVNFSFSFNIDRNGTGEEKSQDKKEDQADMKQLSEKMKAVVMQTIVDERRPGGLLYR